MSEFKQVGAVHRQLELMGLTEDEDLKVLPWGEGEEGQLPLLVTPGFTQVRVPDEDAWLQAGAQMESDVLRPAVAEVHGETGTNIDER